MIKIREYPSQERLKALFDYNDGNLYWKDRPRSDFKTSQGYGAFHASCAGKKANTGRLNDYEIIKINGEQFLTHRLIFIWHFGQLDIGMEVDHRDTDQLNNRIENLRKATRKSNCQNTGLNSRNTSGVKGVSWDKARSKWQVQIGRLPDRVSARFDSKDAAEEFARKTREKIHGEFHNHG